MPADHTTPYISVVVAARNDNHGGNMLARMQAFLDCWIAQAVRYNLSSEIIVVEWNPPPDRPQLIDVLRWPADLSSCAVRFVEVPREVHEHLPNSGAIALHQMIAKNVGIRRARGQFVLVTNLDILFPEAMMRFLAERRLAAGVMYRMDRLDVSNDLPAGGVDELLAFCESHVLRAFTREGGFSLDADGVPVPVPDDIVGPDAGIRLRSGWHAIERSDFEAWRWTDPEAVFLFQRPRMAAPRLLMDVEAGPSAGAEPVTLEVVDPAGRVLAGTTWNGRAMLRLHFPPEISSGRLTLRVRGGGLPLLRDPRILHLRVFSLVWETAPEWLQAASLPRESNGASEPAIRVLSTGERQIQFALRPGPGAALRSVEIDVRDAAGNVVLHAAEHAAGGDHLVTLNLDFGLSDGPQASLPPASWLLELVRAKQAEDWHASYHSVHPLAATIRRSAYLHTHACGDFTLLSRDDWFRMRAYPEFPIWPMHIDALFCYAAFHAGIREEILRDPLRIYHIEHLSAAGWTPEGAAARSARLEAKGLSEMQYSEFTRWVNQMRRFNAPLIFTMENWGLADVTFREVSVSR